MVQGIATADDFFVVMFGIGAECNELLIIYCIFFVLSCICGGGPVPYSPRCVQVMIQWLSNNLVTVRPQDQNRVDVLY